MAHTIKQMKQAIKRHNDRHCVKLSGTKATLQSRITSKNIKVLGGRLTKTAARTHSAAKRKSAPVHSASKRKSAPVASATGMTKKQARMNKKAAARAKALGLGGYGARKGHFM